MSLSSWLFVRSAVAGTLSNEVSILYCASLKVKERRQKLYLKLKLLQIKIEMGVTFDIKVAKIERDEKCEVYHSTPLQSKTNSVTSNSYH